MKRYALVFFIIIYSISITAKVSIGDEIIYENIRYRVTCLNPEEVFAIGQVNSQFTIEIPTQIKNTEGRIFTVVGIGQNAFYNSHCETLLLPNTIRIIEAYAFWNSWHLRTFEMPSSIEYIGDNAFVGCKFTQLHLPHTVKTIGKYAFNRCSALAFLTLSDSLKEIPDGAFYDCSSLMNVKIPEKVARIGDDAFANCI